MSNYINNIALMSEGGNAGGGNMVFTLISFGVIIVFFYLFLIRPQKKKDKESQAMRDSIQIGDEILTIGGIVGIVVSKTEDTIVIETGGNKNKLRIKSWAVQENLTMTEKAAEAAKAAKAAKKSGKVGPEITTGKSKKDKE